MGAAPVSVLSGQLQGPGVGGHHHVGRGLRAHRGLRLEDAVLGALVASVPVGVAAHPPEAVVPLAPQRPLRDVEPGVGEGDPHLRAVARHRMVEAAVAQQPEVGHPQVVAASLAGPADPARPQQVRRQPVHGLQHGQSPQRGLHPTGRGGPRRVLVAVLVPLVPVLTGPQEGRAPLALQMRQMGVVQVETTTQLRHRPGVPGPTPPGPGPAPPPGAWDGGGRRHRGKRTARRVRNHRSRGRRVTPNRNDAVQPAEACARSARRSQPSLVSMIGARSPALARGIRATTRSRRPASSLNPSRRATTSSPWRRAGRAQRRPDAARRSPATGTGEPPRRVQRIDCRSLDPAPAPATRSGTGCPDSGDGSGGESGRTTTTAGELGMRVGPLPGSDGPGTLAAAPYPTVANINFS